MLLRLDGKDVDEELQGVEAELAAKMRQLELINGRRRAGRRGEARSQGYRPGPPRSGGRHPPFGAQPAHDAAALGHGLRRVPRSRARRGDERALLCGEDCVRRRRARPPRRRSARAGHARRGADPDGVAVRPQLFRQADARSDHARVQGDIVGCQTASGRPRATQLFALRLVVRRSNGGDDATRDGEPGQDAKPLAVRAKVVDAADPILVDGLRPRMCVIRGRDHCVTVSAPGKRRRDRHRTDQASRNPCEHRVAPKESVRGSEATLNELAHWRIGFVARIGVCSVCVARAQHDAFAPPLGNVRDQQDPEKVSPGKVHTGALAQDGAGAGNASYKDLVVRSYGSFRSPYGERLSAEPRLMLSCRSFVKSGGLGHDSLRSVAQMQLEDLGRSRRTLTETAARAPDRSLFLE